MWFKRASFTYRTFTPPRSIHRHTRKFFIKLREPAPPSPASSPASALRTSYSALWKQLFGSQHLHWHSWLAADHSRSFNSSCSPRVHDPADSPPSDPDLAEDYEIDLITMSRRPKRKPQKPSSDSESKAEPKAESKQQPKQQSKSASSRIENVQRLVSEDIAAEESRPRSSSSSSSSPSKKQKKASKAHNFEDEIVSPRSTPPKPIDPVIIDPAIDHDPFQPEATGTTDAKDISAIRGPLYLANLRESAESHKRELESVTARVDGLNQRLQALESSIWKIDDSVQTACERVAGLGDEYRKEISRVRESLESKQSHAAHLSASKLDDLESSMQSRIDRTINAVALPLADKLAALEKRLEDVLDEVPQQTKLEFFGRQLVERSIESSKAAINEIASQRVRELVDEREVKMSDKVERAVTQLQESYQPELNSTQEQIKALETLQTSLKASLERLESQQQQQHLLTTPLTSPLEVMLVSPTSDAVRLQVGPEFLLGLKSPSPTTIASTMLKLDARTLREVRGSKNWVLKAVMEQGDLVFVNVKPERTGKTGFKTIVKDMGKAVLVLGGLGAAVVAYLQVVEI
ncbi:hypothetical protein BZA70DRAFT_100725 [Myxozyma melibiosi]|uniref:Uncharacterized protein n=1 Tax=Myxozyma melibiosi TaxID=54550 RepID=A0ABR1EYL4_9ASCO